MEPLKNALLAGDYGSCSSANRMAERFTRKPVTKTIQAVPVKEAAKPEL